MVPVAPVVTGITCAFKFLILKIYILRSLCFEIFSASFLITLLSPGILLFLLLLLLLLLLLSSSFLLSQAFSSWYFS